MLRSEALLGAAPEKPPNAVVDEHDSHCEPCGVSVEQLLEIDDGVRCAPSYRTYQHSCLFLTFNLR